MYKRKLKSNLKEEDVLLEYVQNKYSVPRVLFAVSALIFSVTQLWFFYKIHLCDLLTYYPLCITATSVSICCTYRSYRNTKLLINNLLWVKRERYFEEILRICQRKGERRDTAFKCISRKRFLVECEASCFAIFFANIVSLAALMFASFYVFRNYSCQVNYFGSVLLASLAIFAIS